MNRERVLSIILAGINFTYIMDFMIMMPLGPQFERLFHLNPHQWSLVISSYTFAAAASGVIAIFLLDFVDRKKSLLFLYGGFIIATVLVGLSKSYEMLLATRAIAGFFGGIIGALILAIIGDVVPNHRRGRAIGIVLTGFSVAASLGVPLGLILGTKWGWDVAFFLIAGISSILFVLAWKFVPSIPSKLDGRKKFSTNAFSGLINVLGDRNQLMAFGFTVLIFFGQFSIIPFMAPYMVANVGFKEIQLTYIYLLGGGLTVFTSPWFGRLADKHGRLKVFLILMVISLIPLFGITHLGPSPIWFALIFSGMFFVFGTGRMIAAAAIVIGTANPDHRGTFMSFRSVVRSLAQGIAAYIAGMIITQGPDGHFQHFAIVGYIGIATSVLSYFILRKIHDKY